MSIIHHWLAGTIDAVPDQANDDYSALYFSIYDATTPASPLPLLFEGGKVFKDSTTLNYSIDISSTQTGWGETAKNLIVVLRNASERGLICVKTTATELHIPLTAGGQTTDTNLVAIPDAAARLLLESLSSSPLINAISATTFAISNNSNGLPAIYNSLKSDSHIGLKLTSIASSLASDGHIGEKLVNINNSVSSGLGELPTINTSLGTINNSLGNGSHIGSKLTSMESSLATGGHIGTKLININGTLSSSFDGLPAINTSLGTINNSLGFGSHIGGKLTSMESSLAAGGHIAAKILGLNTGIDNNTAALGRLEDIQMVEVGPGFTGPLVTEIHSFLVGVGYKLPDSEASLHIFGSGTEQAVRDFQSVNNLPATGIVDAETRRKLRSAYESRGSSNIRLEGRVLYPDGRPARYVTLIAIPRLDTGASGAAVSVEVTDATGYFALSLPSNAKQIVTLTTATATGTVNLATGVQLRSKRVTLDLVVPLNAALSAAVNSEFLRLNGLFSGGIVSLIHVEETTSKQDFSFWHTKTGWDARVIALGVTAAQLAKSASGSSDPSSDAIGVFYALLRVGLPSKQSLLARVEVDVVKEALKKAHIAQIVRFGTGATTGGGVAEFVAALEVFDDFVDYYFWREVAPGAVSSLDAIFNVTLNGPQLKNSTPEGTATAQLTAFREFYFDYEGPESTLWTSLPSTISAENRLRLQVYSRLAALTQNHAPLMAEVMSLLPVESTVDAWMANLVELGFHTKEAWAACTSLTGPSALVPSTYEGADLNARRDSYIETLARRVQQEFPTSVIAKKLEDGDIVTAVPGLALALLVRRLVDLVPSFRFGQGGLNKIIRDYGALSPSPGPLFATVAYSNLGELLAELKRLQRLFQLAPSERVLGVLLENNFQSAQDIVDVPRDVFITKYGATTAMGDEEAASITYRKAVQVVGVTSNLLTGLRQWSSGPTVRALSASKSVTENLKSDLIEQFPTLENIFGSTDFVACEECQSTLSPSAYLVDLLDFINPGNVEWNEFLDEWSRQHGGADYGDDYKKPFAVLMGGAGAVRRPDLARLQLTCENTHVHVPYIDLANEVLEQAVAPETLDFEEVFNTRDVAVEDLRAEPQRVSSAASVELKAKTYPLTLPFDNATETTRRLFELSGSSLATAMDAVREPAADVLAEELGISSAEYGVLTTPLSEETWYNVLYGYDAEPSIDSDSPASKTESDLWRGRTLARRLGVSYKELDELLKTAFVNPVRAGTPLVDRMGLSVLEIGAFAERLGTPQDVLYPGEAAFRARVKSHAMFFGVSEATVINKIKAAWDDTTGTLRAAIILFPHGAENEFDEYRVQCAAGTPLTWSDYVRINLFVRFWRKLGGSIGQVDRTLMSYFNTLDATEESFWINAKVAITCIALERRFARLANTTDADDIESLRTIWKGIDTTGPRSLYSRIFLSGARKADSPFDHVYGEYLADSPPTIASKALAIQSAISLSESDIVGILSFYGQSFESATLTLSNLSALFRVKQLARVSGHSVSDLLKMMNIFGPSFFDIWVDMPEKIIRKTNLLRALAFLKSIGLTVEDSLYLFQHQLKPGGKYWHSESIQAEQYTTLTQKLADLWSLYNPSNEEVQNIEGLRAIISELLPEQAVAHFFKLWNNEFEEEDREAAIEEFAQTTKAYFPPFLLTDLPEIFPSSEAEPEEVEEMTAEVAFGLRGIVLATKALKAIVESVATVTEAPPSLVHALLMEFGTPLSGGGSDDFPGASRLLGGYLDLVRIGAAAHFLDSTGTILSSNGIVLVDEAAVPASEVRPAGTQQVRLEGFIELQGRGPYRLSTVGLGTGTTVDFKLSGPARIVPESFTKEAERASIDFTVEADGSPVPYSATFAVLGTSTPQLVVDAVGEEPLGIVVFRPHRRSHIWLHKAIQLCQAFGLDAADVLMMQKMNGLFGHFGFFNIPSEATINAWNPLVPVAAYADVKRRLFPGSAELAPVIESAHGRTSPASGALSAAKAALRSATLSRLATLLDVSVADVDAAATAIGAVVENETFNPASPPPEVSIVFTGLATADDVRRFSTALKVARNLGTTVTKMTEWTNSTRTEANAKDLRNAVRQRFDRDAWRRLVRPVSDAIRQKRRDALVAYLLRNDAFESAESLFEWLLIDPMVEPIVETSRVQLAISSVQTFIQRCLMNLEQKVHPSAINRKQWEWMKRYRLWEASRKIFLYPENWLEPELRESRTEIFQELEQTVVAGTFTHETALLAFKEYVSGLERVGQPEIVSVFSEEDQEDLQGSRAGDIIHVLARTQSTPRQYFARRFEQGEWTPWTTVPVSADGDHVALVIWNGHPHVFWVNFQMEPAGTGASGSGSAGQQVKVKYEVYWIEYSNGKWSAQSSTGMVFEAKPTPYPFKRETVPMHVTIDRKRGRLLIHLGGAIDTSVQFGTRNEPATPYVYGEQLLPMVDGMAVGNSVVVASQELQVRVPSESTTTATPAQEDRLLLKGTSIGKFRVAFPSNVRGGQSQFSDVMQAPFFFQDTERTFFITPRLREKKMEDQQDAAARTPKPSTPTSSTWAALPVQAYDPAKRPGFVPNKDPRMIETGATQSCWLTSPGTFVTFVTTPSSGTPQELLIGRDGALTVSRVGSQLFMARIGGTPFTLNEHTPGFASAVAAEQSNEGATQTILVGWQGITSQQMKAFGQG